MAGILTIIAAAMLFLPLIYAAVSDFRKMTIPNWVSVTIAAAFPVYAFAVWPAIDLTMHLVVASVFFGTSLICWFAGWLGGGDVKLLGAVGLWLGTNLAAAFLLLLAVLSVLMAGGLIIVRWWVRRRGRPVAANGPAKRIIEMATGGQFAYGVPIVLAGMLTLPRLFF